MSLLHYPRHFLLLGVGSAALAFSAYLPSSLVPDRLFVLFGLCGALHALAVVLALRSSSSWMSRLGFVAAAAAVSMAAPFGVLMLTGIVTLDPVTTIFLALALTSALGAAAYGLLVRGVWAPFLSSRWLVVTVGACVVATLSASLVIGVVPIPRDLLLPALWWLGFSASLYIADRYKTAKDGRPSPGHG